VISDFIYVDAVTVATNGEQQPAAARPQQEDLEGHVMAMEERWCVLCDCIDRRRDALKEVLSLWLGVRKEAKELLEWMSCAEATFKKMEQSPTEETAQLMLQLEEITVSSLQLVVPRLGGRGQRLEDMGHLLAVRQ